LIDCHYFTGHNQIPTTRENKDTPDNKHKGDGRKNDSADDDGAGNNNERNPPNGPTADTNDEDNQNGKYGPWPLSFVQVLNSKMIHVFDATVTHPMWRIFYNIATTSASRLLTSETGYTTDKQIIKLVKSYPVTPSLIYDNLKHGPTSHIKFSHFAGYPFHPNIGLRVQVEHMRCHWRHSDGQSKQSIAIANNHVMSSGQHYLSIQFNNFSE